MFKIAKKLGLALAGTAVVTAAVVAGTTLFAQPEKAAAAPNYSNCSGQVNFPNTAIDYCGMAFNVNNPSLNDYLSSLQTYFDDNTDGPNPSGHTHTDIRSFYSSHGLTDSMLKDGNWVLGETVKDGSNHGTMMYNGAVVGTNAKVYFRCYGDTAPACPSGVAHGTPISTTDMYFGSHSTMKTLIHMTNGVVDFAVWVDCGNLVIVTPPPKPELSCAALTGVKTDSSDTSVSYKFTATANVKNNPTITGYKFDFGDSTSPVTVSVTNNATTASTTHQYDASKLTQDLVAKVYVNGTISAKTCEFTIPAIPKQQLSFACKALTPSNISSTDSSKSFTFTAATTTGQNIDTAKDYQFFYTEDNGAAVSLLQANGDTSLNNVQHTFSFDTASDHTFTVYFVATSKTGLKTDQSDKNCQYSFPTNHTLVNVGPGETFGLVAGVSVLGAGLHQLLMRRRLS